MDKKNSLPPSIGTTLKMLVTADLEQGLHLEDVDFFCEFFRNGLHNSQKVTKSQMKKISSDEYIAVVDTRTVGTGEYYMRFTAFIPDMDVDGDLREEVVVVPTGIKILS